MGGALCNCLNKREDPKDLVLADNDGEAVEKARHPRAEYQPSPDDADHFKQSEGYAVKIQSHYRGHVTRKAMKDKPPLEPSGPVNGLSENQGSGRRPAGREIQQVPDYSNPDTRATEQRLGAFVYDRPTDAERDLEQRPPYELENGAIYMGQWSREGLRSGRGIQIWPDGSKYEGYWNNDMANGKGRLIHADGDVYEGDWVNDKAHGYGVYTHMDGAMYTGQWKDDKQHGSGVETWPDGAKYEGNYEAGKKHGKGKFHWADNSIYEGEFYNNNIHGFGVYVWSDHRRYEGGWKNNKMEGHGTFTWADGRRYVGEYLDDKKHGQGEFIWPDGRRYTGAWYNGKQHGRGVYTSADGKAKEGEWKDGKRVQWINSKQDPSGQSPEGADAN
jgi:hypothetical protein